MTIIKRKEFKANEELYNVIPDMHANGSVTFLADLPKNAIVTGVFVKGKSLEDYRLDTELGHLMRTIYPRTEEYEGHRVVAVFVCENSGGKLYTDAVMHDIESFTVEYIETAIAEI